MQCIAPRPSRKPCAQANDIAMLADMARYMQNVYTTVAPLTATDFPHSNLAHLYWWDWNANSGDTGGLVQNDWVTVRALFWDCRTLLCSCSSAMPEVPTPTGTPAPGECGPPCHAFTSCTACCCGLPLPGHLICCSS